MFCKLYIGACWCGPLDFVDSDCAARIVTSGAKICGSWEASDLTDADADGFDFAIDRGGQFPGFFTTISSNGKSNFIIWAFLSIGVDGVDGS